MYWSKILSGPLFLYHFIDLHQTVHDYYSSRKGVLKWSPSSDFWFFYALFASFLAESWKIFLSRTAHPITSKSHRNIAGYSHMLICSLGGTVIFFYLMIFGVLTLYFRLPLQNCVIGRAENLISSCLVSCHVIS